MSDPFYRAFEDRYRGSREMIAARLRVYLPFIAPLPALYRPARALDVGCGRGEWLELAGAAGLAASGIDLDDGMLAACRARGLAVRTADALATLRGMGDASLALLSAFHLVEHLPFDDVLALITEALRVLQPGGLLILESPTPENLVVGASSFYLDPSHLRPLHPALLSFAAEHAGFGRVKVLRLQEEPALRQALRGAQFVGLKNVLDGVSPDYAVVAQKAAAPEVLARFDAAFAPAHGCSFEQLANRYDEQLALAREEARVLARRVERNAAGLEHAGERMRALEARVAGAEAKADQMAQQVIALLSSRSWRVTAPLRAASGAGIALRNALRQGALGSALRRRASRGVRALGQAVLRNRRAKRAARRVLVYFPGLQARLYALMYRAPLAPGAPPPAGHQAGDLSPRARRAYRDLKQALQRKAH